MKSPFDIIADKFRGYIGMTMDMHERPDEVMAAVEAMMPHMLAIAKASADPARILPVSIWMHRGCVPFINPQQFDRYFWPTLKPIIEELWADGHQTLFYAEGKWHHHWDRFLELPEGSIIMHCDRDDVFAAKKKFGGTAINPSKSPAHPMNTFLLDLRLLRQRIRGRRGSAGRALGRASDAHLGGRGRGVLCV
ncbi:MAG: hypothetical protein WCJ14_14085 [Verrucomicrobiota bacterium]